MASFSNIVFVQGDCCQEKDESEKVMEECDAVIHMVGSITDAFNYKKVLSVLNDTSKPKDCIAKAMRDPANTLLNPQKAFEALNWMKDVATVTNEQSLES